MNCLVVDIEVKGDGIVAAPLKCFTLLCADVAYRCSVPVTDGALDEFYTY